MSSMLAADCWGLSVSTDDACAAEVFIQEYSSCIVIVKQCFTNSHGNMHAVLGCLPSTERLWIVWVLTQDSFVTVYFHTVCGIFLCKLLVTEAQAIASVLAYFMINHLFERSSQGHSGSDGPAFGLGLSETTFSFELFMNHSKTFSPALSNSQACTLKLTSLQTWKHIVTSNLRCRYRTRSQTYCARIVTMVTDLEVLCVMYASFYGDVFWFACLLVGWCVRVKLSIIKCYGRHTCHIKISDTPFWKRNM